MHPFGRSKRKEAAEYQKGIGKNMGIKGNDTRIRCSFCGKTEDQVRKLIAGPDGVYICDECIEICAEIIEEEFTGLPQADDTEINLMKPIAMFRCWDPRGQVTRCWLRRWQGF